jgi:hypothetical protein
LALSCFREQQQANRKPSDKTSVALGVTNLIFGDLVFLLRLLFDSLLGSNGGSGGLGSRGFHRSGGRLLKRDKRCKKRNIKDYRYLFRGLGCLNQ